LRNTFQILNNCLLDAADHVVEGFINETMYLSSTLYCLKR
jgi:hypothetical protein